MIVPPMLLMMMIGRRVVWPTISFDCYIYIYCFIICQCLKEATKGGHKRMYMIKKPITQCTKSHHKKNLLDIIRKLIGSINAKFIHVSIRCCTLIAGNIYRGDKRVCAYVCV